MMDENGEISEEAAQAISDTAAKSAVFGEAVDMNHNIPTNISHETKSVDPESDPFMNGAIRTLDGDIAGDEFAADAINYQILLGKIDSLLEKLKLDA